jgi:putative transposase
MPDHIHILIGMRPDIALSDLVRDIKSCSTVFMNKIHPARERFAWQTGFGAFACSRRQLATIVRYIERQELRHARATFAGELRELLRIADVPFDERYLPVTDEH